MEMRGVKWIFPSYLFMIFGFSLFSLILLIRWIGGEMVGDFNVIYFIFDDMVDWDCLKLLFLLNFCFPGGGARLKRDYVVVVN